MPCPECEKAQQEVAKILQMKTEGDKKRDAFICEFRALMEKHYPQSMDNLEAG